jgi:hypothetical protein
MASVTLRIPEEWTNELKVFWRQLRIIDGASSDLDLVDEVPVEPFDGQALSEWLVPLTQASTPILTGILGYLVARKGELEIHDGDKRRKFKNMSPSQIREVMDILENHKKE